MMQIGLLLLHVLLSGFAVASTSVVLSHECPTSLLQTKVAVQHGKLTAGQLQNPAAMNNMFHHDAPSTAPSTMNNMFHNMNSMCHDRTIDAAYTPSPGRRPVVWLHVKKAAGTTVCCEASRRENIAAPQVNCAYNDTKPFTPGYHGFGWTSTWTCEERASLMAASNFTWTAVERLLYPQDLCHSSFLYGTILRNPLDFIESITNSKSDYMAPLRDGLRPGCQMDFPVPHDTSHDDDSIWFDNFATRSLGGYDREAVPLGGLNESHFEHARAVLQSFDVVLLFHFMAEQRSKAVMEAVIGWPVPWESSHANPTESNASLATELSPEQLQCLASINHWDAELIAWAQAEFYP